MTPPLVVRDSMEQDLLKYLNTWKPLGHIDISEIAPLSGGKSNNHLNYKVMTSGGVFVARVVRQGNAVSYSNLADEFTILKFVERYGVAPKAIAIDLEHFQLPVLFEEYIGGSAYNAIPDCTDAMFDGLMRLLLRISQVGIGGSEFPFKFTYTTYETNFKTWDMRIKEICQMRGNEDCIPAVYTGVVKSAKVYLGKIDAVLKSAKPEFIYNDVHPGNVFWLAESQ